MDWIELVNMEYGECVVLGTRRGEILMVDCGSVNQTLRDGDVPLSAWYETLGERYAPAQDRYFLLTHYHKDHIAGFFKLLEREEGYFHRVFLPRAPVDETGRPLLLEYALFAYLFQPTQSEDYRVNTACVRMFRTLREKLGEDRIFTLGKGDRFSFGEVDYQVLWPRVEDFPFDGEIRRASEALNVLFASPFQPECVKRFVKLKEEFLSLYLRCCQNFAQGNRALPQRRREDLDLLEEVLSGLEALREELGTLPAAHDVREILNDPLFAQAYSNGLNSSSVIFQNLRVGEAGPQDLLMTGDAPPEILWEISPELYDGYYLLKAPHHGTASAHCSLFPDMSFAHILISNGEYHAGGAISQDYIDREDSIRHCTSHNACKWFAASGACCNRLCYCYDQEKGPGLALKCSAAAQGRSHGGCLIRVVTPSGEGACLCDVSPAGTDRRKNS